MLQWALFFAIKHGQGMPIDGHGFPKGKMQYESYFLSRIELQCQFPSQSRVHQDQNPQGLLSVVEESLAQLLAQRRPQLMASGQQQLHDSRKTHSHNQCLYQRIFWTTNFTN